jgi:uncharacterized protein
MHIQLEKASQQAIQSYSDVEIKVNSILYQKSVIIGQEQIITDWPVRLITELDDALLRPILKLNPEIILIGHAKQGLLPPIAVLQQLSQLRIGVEIMSIGAASRTFNVLLSEDRAVVAGFIIASVRQEKM